MPWTPFFAYCQGGILLCMLAVAIGEDCRERRIANWLTGGGGACGLLLWWLRDGWGTIFPPGGLNGGLSDSLIAVLVVLALFGGVYLAGGLGAGDVKLMAAVGALTGLRFSLWVMLHTVLAGLPLALFMLAWRGELRTELGKIAHSRGRWFRRAEEKEATYENTHSPLTLPYAVAIALGVLWTFWLYHDRGMAMPVF